MPGVRGARGRGQGQHRGARGLGQLRRKPGGVQQGGDQEEAAISPAASRYGDVRVEAETKQGPAAITRTRDGSGPEAGGQGQTGMNFKSEPRGFAGRRRNQGRWQGAE